MRLLHDRILCLAAAFPDTSIAALDQNEHRFLNRSPLSCVRSASGGTLWSYMTDPTDERHASAPSRTADLASALPHVWITADHHFGHANIVVYAGRPFSADQQDAEMARRWRTTVPSDEAVLHLGDLVVGGNAPGLWELVSTLSGNPRWLVLGNHDRPHRIGLIRAAGFTIIEPPELGYRNWLVRFTHRPLPAAELGQDQLNVHGHTHSKVASTDLRWVNVSVEATDYRPVRLHDLLDERIDELTRTHCP